MSDSEPTFQIEKIYVKDLSLELPNAPQVFMQSDQPQLEVQIASEASNVAENMFEVTVGVTGMPAQFGAGSAAAFGTGVPQTSRMLNLNLGS